MRIPVTFPDGVAAVKTERPEASGETPPGCCRRGDDLQALTERLARLERLHKAELSAAVAMKRKPAPDCIMKRTVRVVSDHCGVSVNAIMGERRPERIARARMLAYYVQREKTGAPYQELGKWWGKDHGTIMHGCQAMRNRLETVPAFRPFVDAILSEI